MISLTICAGRLALVADPDDGLGDRHVDAVRAGQVQHRPAALDALGGLAGALPAPPRASSPRPSFSPKVRLRDSGELQVATRSPRPARPANVVSSAPSASPSRAVSASPRVISEARVLSPKPSPSAMPQASAMTFFTAPPSSQPTTSGFVYGRKYGVWQAACSASARSASVQAMTVAAGCSSAISRARFGPDSTATRSGPAPVTSQMTSLIRFVVPSSMPFIRRQQRRVRRQQRRPAGRGCPAATATARPARRSSAPSSASAGVRGRPHAPAGSRTPGR